MPVNHDLYADLKFSKEEVQRRRAEDPFLNSLIDKYSTADAEVVEAEQAQSNDDVVKKLKEKRLRAKDKIVEQLQMSSGTPAQASKTGG